MTMTEEEGDILNKWSELSIEQTKGETRQLPVAKDGQYPPNISYLRYR